MQPGSLIHGRYQVVGKIGAGGYGEIYKAIQSSTGQLVAIKMLLNTRLDDPEAYAEEMGRFERETKLIGRLSHPNIVRLVDSGVFEDRRFMVLEYVDGDNLARVIKQHGPLSNAVTKRVMAQVLDALSEAHNAGIIHRDLKPANIMLSGPEARPNAKVLDFGIAGIVDEAQDENYMALTQSGNIPGTPSYMAPEQIRTGNTYPQSDLYALGLILLECLTGQRAVTGQSVGDICVKQVTEPIDIPHGIRSGPLGAIIARACAKDPAERYVSAEEFLHALERADTSSLTPMLTGNVNITPLATPQPLIVDNAPTQLTPSPMRQWDGWPTGNQEVNSQDAVSVTSPGIHSRRKAGLAAIICLCVIGAVALVYLIGSADGEAAGEAAEAKEDPTQGEEAPSKEAKVEPPSEVATSEEGVGADGSAADVVEPEAAPAEPLTTTWFISSEPPASVSIGDEIVCGKTPCQVIRDTSEDPVEILLSASGFKSSTLVLPPDGGDVTTKLDKTPVAKTASAKKKSTKKKKPKKKSPKQTGTDEERRIKEF